MSEAKKINITITDRDVFILHFLFNNRGALTQQLINKFFPNSSYQAGMIRLKDLCEFGVIKGERDAVKEPYVYYITRDGINILMEKGLIKEPVKILPRFTRSGISHDLEVIDIRLALEADDVLNIGEWVTEWELARIHNKGVVNNLRNTSYTRRPDGIFTITRDGFKRQFLLEYIRRTYGRARLIKILDALEYQYPYYSVLFVCYDDLGANVCLKTISERGKWKAKYLITWKETVINNKGLMKCEMIKGDETIPSFEHRKEVYIPDGKIILEMDTEKKRQEHIKCNKESENF